MSHIFHRVRFWSDHRWAPPRMSDYLDGEMSNEGRRRMERHVVECAECRRLLRGLRAMLYMLRGYRGPTGEVDALRISAAVRPRLGGSDGPG